LPYRRRRHSSSNSSAKGDAAGSGRRRVSSRLVKRLVILLIGIWFGSILVVALAVPLSFNAVDSVMADPPKEAGRIMQLIGPVSARLFLVYQIAEANRAMFGVWGWVQLGLGLALFLLYVFAMPVHRLPVALVTVMLVLAATMNFTLVPRLETITRNLELTPSATTAPDVDHFLLLHRGFTAFEVGIVILGSVLLWLLMSRSEATLRSSSTKEEFAARPGITDR